LALDPDYRFLVLVHRRFHSAMSKLLGYDKWKLASPPEPPTCEVCGEYMRRAWPSGCWACERCDAEDEYRQAQIDEQESAEFDAAAPAIQ
jgi:hypothetical protein